ncbi:Ribosomal silencing factor RsfS [Rubripirellula lacrimiformis]|uniref:Ribosomal silencing factor RsfS n=1 Tax=Rubripirellula lacrimiformis TaxID=1930273 RepID=A0A517N8F9_9BACT|nr:ribosome silencing factor [Rubripirellula lacrimiformis]QDT03424.1 Ribosomal silencing factor RsfS [Rubripirellula lacrimiformis]
MSDNTSEQTPDPSGSQPVSADSSAANSPVAGKPSSKSAANENPMVNPSRAIRPLGVEYGRKLATEAARVALENNGQDVMVIDVCAQSAEFDFFVLATGTSRRQLHAISEQIDDALEKGLGDHRMGIEGYDESRWIVLDYGSVVVHLFDDETREYYDLESLWADGKSIPLEELGLPPQA